MALKMKEFTVEDEGEDKGKTFLITRMPAAQTEKWGIRALNALLASGIEIPDSVAEQGISGLISSGFMNLSAFKGVPWHQMEPLLDEMMLCVKRIADPNRADVTTRKLVDSDTEEVTTRLKLRAAWFELHFGFLGAGKPSTSDVPANQDPSTT